MLKCPLGATHQRLHMLPDCAANCSQPCNRSTALHMSPPTKDQLHNTCAIYKQPLNVTVAAGGSLAALCQPTCAAPAASVLPALPAGTPQAPPGSHAPAAPVQPAAARCLSPLQQHQTCTGAAHDSSIEGQQHQESDGDKLAQMVELQHNNSSLVQPCVEVQLLLLLCLFACCALLPPQKQQRWVTGWPNWYLTEQLLQFCLCSATCITSLQQQCATLPQSI
jgi:hypothetical protein